MYILKICGESIISNTRNLSYLIDNLIKWFRSDIVVLIYSYPDGIHIAIVHSGKCTRTYLEYEDDGSGIGQAFNPD